MSVSTTLSGSRHTGQRVPLDSGEQSLSGRGSGQSGNSIGAQFGDSGSGLTVYSPTTAEYEAGGAAGGFLAGLAIGTEAGSWGGPVGAAIGAVLGSIAGFLEEIFGGGGSPPIIRQLRHGRHPLYAGIIGIRTGLIPTEDSTVSNPSSKPCSACHCGFKRCHTETMLVTAYDNGFASTGKNPTDPGYGITAAGTKAGVGTIAAPRRFAFFTGMYVPGYGCGTVLDRGGAIRGNHIDVWLPPPLSTNWGTQFGVSVEVCDD
jgi:3D (Asp-Asp-Asp) domain-containing protein